MATINPSRHSVEFGESVTWRPPAGASRFFVWEKRSRQALPDMELEEIEAPRWIQVAGYDLEADAALTIDGPRGSPSPTTEFTLDQDGASADWPHLIAIGTRFDPEVAMITANDADGRALSIDRYALPLPNSTDAATIAAQERQVLERLLTMRGESLRSGTIDQSTPDGTSIRRWDVLAIDRRISEVRARIAWFDSFAAGNALPRAEHW